MRSRFAASFHRFKKSLVLLVFRQSLVRICRRQLYSMRLVDVTARTNRDRERRATGEWPVELPVRGTDSR